MAAFNLKATTKGITALIIVAVVILFGSVLAYVGFAGKLSSLTSEVKAKQKQVDESKQIAQKLEKSKLDYLDARSQVRFLEASVSTQEYVPTLLKQLEHLGSSVNLKVLGVRPDASSKSSNERSLTSGKQASEGNVDAASQSASAGAASASQKKQVSPYDQIHIDVQIKGRYMNALDFLYRLTSFPKIISVDGVAMDPPGTGGQEKVVGAPTLSIKLSLTAFVLKQEPVPSEPASQSASADARKVSQSRKAVATSEAG
jgi:Tfp pilus assembly protein PilO